MGRVHSIYRSLVHLFADFDTPLNSSIEFVKDKLCFDLTSVESSNEGHDSDSSVDVDPFVTKLSLEHIRSSKKAVDT